MTLERTLFDVDSPNSRDATPTRFDLPDADVAYYPRHFGMNDADRLFEELLHATSWHQDHIRIHGRELPVPRLTAWHGDADRVYAYSGIDLSPLPWTPALLEIRRSVEAVVADAGSGGWSSNSVLLNLYRDGRDSVAWHADDEPELGHHPVIASVSLGATRRFHMRHRTLTDTRLRLDLVHGSLLVMRGPTQPYWMHQVPKTAKTVGPRVNLTYRFVVGPG